MPRRKTARRRVAFAAHHEPVRFRGRLDWRHGMARKPAKLRPVVQKPAPKVAARAADGDDTVVTALTLADAKLTPVMQAYFDKCTEKLGFVPNVLKAYAFDMPKLEAFVTM